MRPGLRGRDSPCPEGSRSKVGTIVEYNPHKRSVNAYPRWIISPPFPSLCCTLGMEQIGKQMEEDGWPFFHKRCPVCGYTLRHFLPVSGELASRWRERADKPWESRWGVFRRSGLEGQVWARRPPGERRRRVPVAKRARRGRESPMGHQTESVVTRINR
jgi:hypothetical protein